MTFPVTRKRRLRKNQVTRDFVAETMITPSDFIYPLFITDQVNARNPVESMPGVFQLSIDNALIEIGKAMELGIRAVMLFGIPNEKDQEATSAWYDDGVIQKATKAIKKQFGDDIIVIADTCLCEYMTHGHCGVLLNGQVLNDPTLELLCRTAISQAEAGADIIAPSDMMDGRIMFIRDSLDDAGYDNVPIMSYAAKYASAFYGPFRDAAGSAPASGDRKSYQMDPRNAMEALDEVELDIDEGADMIMVKPAMAYQDILYRIREFTTLPITAYSVSGEYAMIKAAAEKGWIDEKAVVLETMTGLKRAGANTIVTYHAPKIAEWLGE